MLAAAGAAAVLGACAPADDRLAPPDIHYGEDVCADCGMIISEPRFAAGLVLEEGGRSESLAFDDIGDLLTYLGKHPEAVVLRAYVHDYDAATWLPAEAATFVRAAGIRSPMGHGLAAFTEPARAAAFAAEQGGQTLSFEELRRATGTASPP